ncbi:helix-turn-helix transcriptional regulator [uncultured Flavonifractor sp.]|uniref:helix-turn-helix transcriptional regulator n=1 Tax=uncultured Flavonifractor sp. TaxID=1193534 RepID=UPI00263A11E9|nr:helix-turn-helix transcriptional regulator [uncultured Flavonifractor sp.]
MDAKHYKTFVRIGLNIMYYRKERGWTQMDLAEAVDLSRNHMQRIEAATAVPSLSTLLDIADALDVPVEKLFKER